MLYLKNAVLIILCTFLSISCAKQANAAKEKEVVINKDDKQRAEEGYSYRPDIVLCPLDAFFPSLTLTVFEGHNGLGEIVYRDQMLDWSVQNRDLQFKDFAVNDMETGLETEFEKSALILFEIGQYYCCMAGVSAPIKIYSDTDVDGYTAGQDLSDLFVVNPANPDQGLANVKYPEMTPVKVFGEIKDQRVQYDTNVPIKEYFTVGTSPLMSVSFGCILSTVGGHENLLNGEITLHFELPVVGINSEGQEESKVITGTISAQQ